MVTYDQVKLAAATGFAVSLLFSLIPPLAAWYNTLGGWRPAFMFVALLAVDLLWLASNCQWAQQCVVDNLLPAFVVLVTAFATNQGTYLMGTKPIKNAVATRRAKKA